MTPHSSHSIWPAEWSPHEATWLAWPHNTDTWPKNLLAAQKEFATFVRTIAEVEPVRILCGGDAMSSAKSMVGKIANVELIDLPTNDAWIRDWGPTFIQHDDNSISKLMAVDWRYDAWGGKYPPFEDDAANASRIAHFLEIECTTIDFTIEGGAIDTNGAGVLLTTESCLLNKNRNGPAAKANIESKLIEQLGVREICWLSGGDISGDDTDGHIDQIARFINETTIVVASEPDTNDANHRTLKFARTQLETFNEQHNNRLEIIDLPSPGVAELNSIRLPASFANFYFANEIVIVPQFDSPADTHSISLIQSLLTDRTVVGLPSRNLAAGFGSFHCLSQQQPRVFA